MIQTSGGRAGSSLSTDRPGYSSARMFLEDKLTEKFTCKVCLINELIKPAKASTWSEWTEKQWRQTLLTLFTAVSGESRRTAALSRDVLAGRALSAAAALHATLPI